MSMVLAPPEPRRRIFSSAGYEPSNSRRCDRRRIHGASGTNSVAPDDTGAAAIGANTDSERAIRWLIALMVLCCDPARYRAHGSSDLYAAFITSMGRLPSHSYAPMSTCAREAVAQTRMLNGQAGGQPRPITNGRGRIAAKAAGLPVSPATNGRTISCRANRRHQRLNS